MTIEAPVAGSLEQDAVGCTPRRDAATLPWERLATLARSFSFGKDRLTGIRTNKLKKTTLI